MGKFTTVKIYVATSWRNPDQEHVVALLRAEGYEVYDFKNPIEGDYVDFHWSDIDLDYRNWTPKQHWEALQHPIAEKCFGHDMSALQRADMVVLIVPSGVSAHLEAGFKRGEGSPVILHMPRPCKPDLMHKMLKTCTTTDEELVRALGAIVSRSPEV